VAGCQAVGMPGAHCTQPLWRMPKSLAQMVGQLGVAPDVSVPAHVVFLLSRVSCAREQRQRRLLRQRRAAKKAAGAG
jgi:hypothetical protein